MLKHYDIEYEIHGSYMDTVYDVDTPEEAMDKVIEDLDDRPTVISKDDITFTLITEIDYDTGLPKENNNA